MGSEGAVLLPAPAEYGKSTLAAALLQAGFTYLSDELGAIDPVTNRAYPYPRYVTLDQATVRRFPGLEERLEDRNGRGGDEYTRFARPQDLGSAPAPPSPIRAVVFLSREREGPPRLDPMPKAEAVERMASVCMNLYRYAERGVVVFSRIASAADTFQVSGGTASERANLLAERFLGPASSV